MSLDERVSRALREMTDDLRPLPDPYGRARARYRRGRRRRMAAMAAAVVAALAITGTAIVGPGRGGDSVATDGSNVDVSWQRMLAWGQRLFDSPTRGRVADLDYMVTLTEDLTFLQANGAFRTKAPVRSVHVLFVDDVGPYRVAFAVFILERPDPATQWPANSVWLAGPRGASVQELASPSAVLSEGDGFSPVEVVSAYDPRQQPMPDPSARVDVAIAPDGCTFATAALPSVDDWRPEPTGSYLVRTPQTRRPEWWQVTCDAVVRDRRPAPGVGPAPLTDAQVDQAMLRARGVAPDRGAVRLAWQSGPSSGDPNSVTGLPAVVWSGRTAGTTAGGGESFDGRAVVLAAPEPGGTWTGLLNVSVESTVRDGTAAAGVDFRTDRDPSDPASVVPIRLGTNSASLLVITPAAATAVRALSEGHEVGRAAVQDAGAVLTAPAPKGLTVEALDAAGNVLGSAVADRDIRNLQVDAWTQE